MLPFSNIVLAWRRTGKGGVGVKIFEKGRNVRVEVTDTGIGKEYRTKLFKRSGGRGLYTAKETANLHGGRVGIISEIGKGSTFWFTLPYLQE
jgi:signal transduction histidine kinase